ncbi:MAG: hypothetical protein ACTSRK_13165 [Promethearchaeota archaeon]
MDPEIGQDNRDAQTRALRKDIGRFFVCHYDKINSKSRFLLTRGIKGIIQKAERDASDEEDEETERFKKI